VDVEEKQNCYTIRCNCQNLS